MSNSDIKKIIIDSLFLSENRPDTIEVRLPNVRGYLSPFKLAYANRIQLVNKSNAENTIQATIDYFKKRNSSLTWVATSEDIASGLPEQLMLNGFLPSRFHKISGMYLETSDVCQEEPSAIKVLEVMGDSYTDTKMIARTFGHSDDVYVKYLYSLEAFYGGIRNRLYQAYLQDIKEPVGFGFCSYLENNSIALMRGGGVVPEHRGKGVYKALFRQRFADACQLGIKKFITQASRDSSYSTCLGLGFEEICPIELYEWSAQ